MEISLLPVLNYDGKKMQIEESVRLDANPSDSFAFKTPVSFSGYALNIGGTIELSGKASVVLAFLCDRCAESFEREIEFSIDERLKKDGDGESDDDIEYIPFSGTAFDLSEILYTDLYINIPSKVLCSEDCKGLCPTCGKNLNSGDCDCNNDRTDPRFDILDKLL